MKSGVEEGRSGEREKGSATFTAANVFTGRWIASTKGHDAVGTEQTCIEFKLCCNPIINIIMLYTTFHICISSNLDLNWRDSPRGLRSRATRPV